MPVVPRGGIDAAGCGPGEERGEGNDTREHDERRGDIR